MVDLFWAALIPGAMGLAAALVGMSFAIRERRRVLRADEATLRRKVCNARKRKPKTVPGAALRPQRALPYE